MPNKYHLIILLVLILSFNIFAETNSKEFIPGVKTIIKDDSDFIRFNKKIPLAVDTYMIPEDKAELIKNCGPNGEEALKLSTKKDCASVIKVRYYPNIEKGYKYKLSVEYKAKYYTEKGEEIGAYIYLVGNNKSGDRTYISLKNTTKWEKIETTFDYNNKNDNMRIFFCLGTNIPKIIFTAGEIYFINLRIEKVEAQENESN